MVGGKWKHLAHPPHDPENPGFTYVDSMWFKYLLSVVSATIAEGGTLFLLLHFSFSAHPYFYFIWCSTVTYPLDLIKTRLQIQGEIASTKGEAVGSPHSYCTLNIHLVEFFVYSYPSILSPLSHCRLNTEECSKLLQE